MSFMVGPRSSEVQCDTCGRQAFHKDATDWLIYGRGPSAMVTHRCDSCAPAFWVLLDRVEELGKGADISAAENLAIVREQRDRLESTICAFMFELGQARHFEDGCESAVGSMLGEFKREARRLFGQYDEYGHAYRALTFEEEIAELDRWGDTIQIVEADRPD